MDSFNGLCQHITEITMQAQENLGISFSWFSGEFDRSRLFPTVTSAYKEMAFSGFGWISAPIQATKSKKFGSGMV